MCLEGIRLNLPRIRSKTPPSKITKPQHDPKLQRLKIPITTPPQKNNLYRLILRNGPIIFLKITHKEYSRHVTIISNPHHVGTERSPTAIRTYPILWQFYSDK